MAEQKLWDNVCSGNKDNLHLSNDIQQFPTGCAGLSVSGMQNLVLFRIFYVFFFLEVFLFLFWLQNREAILCNSFKAPFHLRELVSSGAPRCAFI